MLLMFALIAGIQQRGYSGPEQYPPQAARRHEQGTTFMMLSIAADGHVTGCQVTKTSHSPDLDAASCEIMLKRAHFTPAHDDKGVAISSQYATKINWRLPND